MNAGWLKPAWKPITKSSLYETLNIPRLYVLSNYASQRNSQLFKDVETYCMFIGGTRSGGSLTGALLDAHPEVILADGMDALRFVTAGFRREQIFQILLDRSKRQAKTGRISAGRPYVVSGQWNGRFAKLRVIGDIKSAVSTNRFGEDPMLLDRLLDTMKGLNVRFIQVVRNPYDSISEMTLRSGRTFESAVHYYVDNCLTVSGIRKRIGEGNLIIIRNDQLISETENTLRGICGFLGIADHEDYLDSCRRFVDKSPVRSRYSVQWSPDLIDAVKTRIVGRFDFLHGYSYEG